MAETMKLKTVKYYLYYYYKMQRLEKMYHPISKVVWERGVGICWYWRGFITKQLNNEYFETDYQLTPTYTQLSIMLLLFCNLKQK